MERKKVTIQDLQAKKQQGEKIIRLQAYDYPMAVMVDRAGVDMILVGDSLGMVMLGYNNTLPVTMEEMLHHCRAVSRGVKYALIVGDLPFMSYQVSTEQAVSNAGRLLKEGGVDAVKLEGGQELVPTIRAIVNAGIPVHGHIGLTPQSVSMLGGFKVQGKDAGTARKLLEDAKALEEAGCFAITVECVPDRLAKMITENLSILTLGIGAGPYCDGQSINTYDLIGYFERFVPKFVKRYANIAEVIGQAIESYKVDVAEGTFPGPEHSFTIKDEELEKILGLEQE